MVNGPPCQQCGYPLRWFAEQNAWGCDRCRQMFPAAPQPHMQQMRPAHAAHTVQGPGHKKSLLPWLVLGAGAIAGVVIAVVIATGGGGGGSAKGVAEDTLAALAAGDASKLAALADTENLYKSFVKCDADRADDSPAELAAREKRRFDKAAEKAKGLKLKLVDFPDVDKLGKDHVIEMPKGSEVAKGCKSTADAKGIDLKMKISVQDGDKPAVEREVELELIAIGGKYYLSRAPKVDKSADVSGQIAKMTELKDQMCACKDMACATKVSQDMSAWAQANSAQMNETAPDPDDMKKLMAITEDMTKCMQKVGDTAMAAPPPPPPDPTPAAPVEMPKACQEWKAGIDKLDHCATIAKATVTALRNSYDRSLAAWSKLSGEARQTVMGSCDSARDAVNNLLKAAGCN